MAHSSRLPLLAGALAALTVVVTSCEPGFTISPLPVSRELQDISGLAPRVTDGYVGFTTGVAASGTPLEQNEEVILSISTSRGDGESLRFRTPVPLTNSSAYRIRREYILSVTAGANAESVLAEVESLGVRHRLFPGGAVASATSFVFAPDEGATVSAVRALPGVQNFEANVLGCVGFCSPGQPNLLHAAIPLDRRASVTINDGVLSVAVGDTLRIVFTGEGNVTRVFERVVQ